MTNLLTRLALAAIAMFDVASAAAQNNDERLPERPELPEYADTNDAMAYYNWGLDALNKNPGDAADAFYWASRLAPNLSAPLYARRVALLMDLSPTRLIGYMQGRKSVRRRDDIRAIDSLEMRARMREPLFYRALDRDLTMAYFTNLLERELGHRVSPNEIRFWLENNLRRDPTASSEWNAWLAYTDRDFHGALELYGRALKRSRDKAYMHTERGQIFFLVQQFDSATASFQQALEVMREDEEDDEELVRVYQSKAMLEYSTAVVYEEAGDADGARAAHGRALMEDLSFYPAHLHLGAIALATGDTAQAVAEFELAAATAPNEATPYLALSVALRDAGQYERAAEMSDRAIELEPYYAVLYLMHGSLLETLGDGLGALRRYQEFIGRTVVDDPRLEWTSDRIQTLRLALDIPPDA